ncbi:MAG: hypothetical protein JSR39_07095 [Verrucomicrobia bacterium]|nr:hypothetical protein [Verrucomicrobiota bacterium]
MASSIKLSRIEDLDISFKSLSIIEEGRSGKCNLSIIDQRMESIYQQALAAAKNMGIPSIVTDKLDLNVNFKSLQISPMVGYNPKKQRIELEIPFLFLFKKSDIIEKNELGRAFEKVFCSRVLTAEEFKTSEALFEFLSDDEAAENAKSFILHHEIAHIYYGDILAPNVSEDNSRKREKRADITAARFSGQAAAAVRCFTIVGEHIPLPNDGTTHPPMPERVAYLQTYLENEEKASDNSSS